MLTIGASLVLTGELTSDEDLRIDGSVHDPVTARACTLTIGEGARLHGDVRGARILVLGAVSGAISATERIELFPSAVVAGSLSANRVVIAAGATFNGRIDMDQRTIAARVAQYKAQHAAR